MNDDHAQPYQEIDPKSSWDEIEVFYDWHDFLAAKWAPGISVTGGVRIRLRRKDSKGWQFRALNDGVTGRKEPNWPSADGAQVRDGGVTWRAEPITIGSLRTSIITSDFPAVDGLTLSLPTDQDLVYRVVVAGGTNGQRYEVRHRVGLANGEKKEGVGVLKVQD